MRVLFYLGGMSTFYNTIWLVHPLAHGESFCQRKRRKSGRVGKPSGSSVRGRFPRDGRSQIGVRCGGSHRSPSRSRRYGESTLHSFRWSTTFLRGSFRKHLSREGSRRKGKGQRRKGWSTNARGLTRGAHRLRIGCMLAPFRPFLSRLSDRRT